MLHTVCIKPFIKCWGKNAILYARSVSKGTPCKNNCECKTDSNAVNSDKQSNRPCMNMSGIVKFPSKIWGFFDTFY